MKAKTNKIWALILAFVLTVSGTVMAIAATPTANDFKVLVNTDKDSYEDGEKIYMSIKIENSTDAKVENVALSYDIPEDIKAYIVDYDKLPTSLDSLDADVTNVFSTLPDNPNTGVAETVMFFVGIMLVAAGIVLAARSGYFKKLASLFMVVVMLFSLNGIANLSAEAANVKIEVSGSKTIKYAGKDKTITVKVVITVADGTSTGTGTGDNGTTDNGSGDASTGDSGISRVSVHDPSIIKEGDTYYIFGSHMAWAKSKDLINWTTFTNNINTDYETMFAAEIAWCEKYTAKEYDVSGNLWAPDIIWNEEMGKWCMYMSINGLMWNSTISLLTADSLDGDWTYVGPVIQSGMSNGFGVTFDYTKVTGETEPADRYECRNSAPQWEPHAIDPCVTYDEDGNLWMSYGSWSGGIGLFRLDNKTGLRDYDTTYELNYGTTDPYFGYKIAGGNQQSGEASYIEQIGDYYYLFMSYGGLVANGGYSMRIFRSEDITGPYVDASGDDARVAYTSESGLVQAGSGAGNINGKVGIKLMTYYQWSYMKYGQVAQGHNSAFVDEDGRAYVVYHTRTNDGTEGHSVRVHQLFVNQDGWLVAAPYEHMGESISETGYTAEEMAGTYEVLYHKQSIDYANLECVTAQELTLNADGTVTGDYEGTWTAQANSPYVTMTLGGVEYNGVFIEQTVENTDYTTLCFTMLGDNEVEVWGSKYLADKDNVALTIDSGVAPVPTQAVGNIDLITEGAFGTTISYESSNTSIIANDGTVTLPDETTTVTLTATYTSGDYTDTKDYEVTVLVSDAEDGKVLVGEYYTTEAFNLSGTTSLPNAFNKANTAGINIYSGMTVEFDVEGTGSFLSNIISFMAGKGDGGRMYFTGGSYLGYNALGGYFDANLNYWSLKTDYIKGDATIKIEFKPSGFSVYANDVLAYTNSDLAGGDLTDYSNVLTWLNESADSIELGTGSWWTDKFSGTISNIKLYAYAIVDDTDTSALYDQTYTLGDYSEWSSLSNPGGLSLVNDGDDRGNYLYYTYSDNDNNRGAYSNISITPDGNYTITVDAKLTAGIQADRATSCFALLTTGATGHTANAAVTGGYILKLYNEEAFGLGQLVWKINDTDTTVEIPKDTWVTITVEVDVTAGTANVNIVDCANGTSYLTNETVTINGSSTTFSGMQLLRGRNSGIFCVDNIKVVD